ncbi:transposase family protein [Amycolatopsis sp. H20-H5]|uniref:transposase family protein n=1 Tax=Amycolatopsis sp. H20-H5 TaxID=3046309 RepID=UPI002DB7DDDC|nr:transposase family protein [Amycolatopsis sp. H20-H5]MEC3981020.1 transposase family protein [Amycolatopsis sp. H20-H5]
MYAPVANTTTSAARADPDLLTRITDWISDGAHALADLGYEGEPETFTIPFRKTKNGELATDQQSYNAIHSALSCLDERANSLLTTAYKALRRNRGCPWRIGNIVAAALVLLHHGTT